MASRSSEIELTPEQAYALAEIAAVNTDLDAACAAVQAMVGQTDGGIAAHYFSGPNGERWKTADEQARGDLLEGYLKLELLFQSDEATT